MLLQVVELPNYVEFSEFVTVSIAIVTLVIAAFWILVSKVGDLATKVAITEKQEKTIEILFSKVNTVELMGNQDRVQFAEAMGRLSTTLGKIEITIENQTEVMQELKGEINNLKKDKS